MKLLFPPFLLLGLTFLTQTSSESLPTSFSCPAVHVVEVASCPEVNKVEIRKNMVLSDEAQLKLALDAFGSAHFDELGPSWSSRLFRNLLNAGITSMSDLGNGCKDETVNLDLELFGVLAEERLSQRQMQQLLAFLPGPKGFRCFRLAQKCAEKVEEGSADVKYVHRPESGKLGSEQWSVPVGDDWTLHVDCAGFVRNVLKYVTKDPFRLSLSDRDFMRAKDFFRFFQTIPYSIFDEGEVPESSQKMKWRRVDDLRNVIPGDVITYRPRGNAAGQAAFTTNDRSDIKHMLKAVRTAELWHEEEGEWKNLVTRNMAKDPRVKEWTAEAKARLDSIGIKSVKAFRNNFTDINAMLIEKDLEPFSESTLALMKECAATTALNTGHIVFASGIAVHKGDNQYRIRVIHSTKFGYRDEDGNITEGVQEYFRRFTLIERSDGSSVWTREAKKAPIEEVGMIDEGDNPYDDMATDDEDEVDGKDENGENGDELDGQADVEVIAARMCF